MTQPSSKLQIDVRQVEDITVMTLRGEITADDGDLVFGRRVDELIKKGQVKIVLNLADVTYIDSSGVGMMVAQLKMVRQRGGDMRLLRLNSRGQRMLALLKLRSTFEAFDDEALAVRSFIARPSAT